MKFKLRQRGQALVELVLVLPILLMLLVFSVYAFFTLSDYLTLQSMAHEAGRLGAASDQIVWLTSPNASEAESMSRQKQVQREINRFGRLYIYTLDQGGKAVRADDARRNAGSVTVSIVAATPHGDPPQEAFVRVDMRVRLRDDIPNIGRALGLDLPFPPRLLAYSCDVPLERALTTYDTNHSANAR